VLGDRFSVADPYLFTLARWLEGDGVDPQRFPKVLQQRQRMAEHALVVKVLAAQKAAAAARA
jgi:glutathione S-transferase